MDKRSALALHGVDAKLVGVVELAESLCSIKFIVTEGLRTLDRQHKLIAEGKSKTIKSKHLTGMAIDIIPIIDGLNLWGYLMIHNIKHLDQKAKDAYREIARAMFQAASWHSIKIRWGNDWNGNGIEVGPDPDESFEDWPHFERVG